MVRVYEIAFGAGLLQAVFMDDETK